jgi:glycosyltransferase involved in cell wall biosynthesis
MIGVSHLDIEKGLAQGIGRPEHFSLIRYGVELDRFGHPTVTPAQMKAELGIPHNALVVGSVTRLSLQKAPLDLVEALAHVAACHPATWFVIVGDGELRSQVEQRLAELGITGRTVLTGLRRDIPELMACFDIFVLSSLWEGLPRVLPQAMATGLPVVCTRVDGSAEAITDGECGFLVEPSQPRALAERVNMLLSDGELRRRMGETGRERASEYSAPRMVEEIEQLYRRLLVNSNL